ncbi:unnamed protein product [Calicophoron daubneyi]|uniref:Uncharacterized protein n=1 Tax=Calicophoron daubneyi TaxID=300641 RepID=A0AAV2TCA6_CALDB
MGTSDSTVAGDFLPVYREINEIVNSFHMELEQSYRAEADYLDAFFQAFYGELGVSKPDRFRLKFTRLAQCMSLIGISSLPLTQMKNVLSGLQDKKRALKEEIASLEESCQFYTDFQAVADEIHTYFLKFSKDPRLKPECIRRDMNSLQCVRNRFAKLSEALTELHNKLPPDFHQIPTRSELDSLEKEIARLLERKAVLEENLSHFSGLSSDTKTAKAQLAGALSQMSSLDSKLVDVIGLNAWS